MLPILTNLVTAIPFLIQKERAIYEEYATKVSAVKSKFLSLAHRNILKEGLGGYFVEEGVCAMDTFSKANFTDSSYFLNAYFTNKSSGSINYLHWDFGDGDTSNSSNPIHHYNSPGKYWVTLTVYDNYCRHRSYSDSIEICLDTSRLGFSHSAISRNLTFTDTSIADAFGYYWDFGDGITDTGQTVNHIYTAVGNYNVCLTVEDSCRSKNICKNIQVCNDTLLAGYNYSTNGYMINFTDSSLNATTWSWDFGDGSPVNNSQNPGHTYTNPGVYYVCLTVNDPCTTNLYCDSIEVCQKPLQANFSHIDSSGIVNFSPLDTNALSYSWDFGDGSPTNNLQNPSHTYTNPGFYYVCLTISNLCFTNTFCDSIEVCQKPPLQLGFSFTDSSNFVNFSPTDTSAVSYLWDFGDGNLSSIANPTHFYQNFGNYLVCLTLSNGCSVDSVCKWINICPFNVVADFNYNSLITQTNIQFTDNSSDAVSHFWDFDDGTFSSLKNPVKFFSNAGVYNVCLTATDSCGNTDTTCKFVSIFIGLNENKLKQTLKVYPNPVTDLVTISLTGTDNFLSVIKLSSASGKTILKKQFSNNQTEVELNMFELPSGIYLLNIQTSNESTIFKLIKD